MRLRMTISLCAFALMASGCTCWQGICEDACSQAQDCSGKSVDMDKCVDDCVDDAACMDKNVSSGCMSALESGASCTSSLSCDEVQKYADGVMGKTSDYPCKSEIENARSDCTQEELSSATKACP